MKKFISLEKEKGLSPPVNDCDLSEHSPEVQSRYEL